MQDTINDYINQLNICKKEELNDIVTKLQYYSDIPIVKDNYDKAMAKAKEVAQKYGVKISY